MGVSFARLRRVLKVLVVNLDKTVSRETLAMVAGGDNSLRQAVLSLRRQGFEIVADRELGYRLLAWGDATGD